VSSALRALVVYAHEIAGHIASRLRLSEEGDLRQIRPKD